jgi:mono/diheme cytochrome c family protein
MRSGINIVLLVALIAVVSLTWMLRRDFTERNDEILPGMVESVPYDAFSPNPNFPDGKTLQKPVAGTISRSFTPLPYRATPEDALRAGKELQRPFANEADPEPERGRMMYATYCQPCHGIGGAGDGPVVQRGFPPPSSLLAEKAVKMEDGTMFHIITYGQANMPSLASQMQPLDRWRAIQFVRSLQAAQKQTAK